jgi:hypothetical protein
MFTCPSPDYKADGETIKSVGAALKAGASELSTSNAIDAAWGLSLVGSGEKDAISALFSSVAAAVQKDPASVDVYEMGALYNASVLVPGAKLPEQVRVAWWALIVELCTFILDNVELPL